MNSLIKGRSTPHGSNQLASCYQCNIDAVYDHFLYLSACVCDTGK